MGGCKHSIDRTTTQQGVELSGNNLMLEMGNNLLAQASTLDAKGNVALQAGGELQLLTADNEVYHFEQSKSKGFLKSKSTEIEQNLGAVLKELGSSANIKHLATSVALTGFNEWAGLSSGAPNAPAPYAQPGAIKVFSWDTFNRVTSNAGISAGIDSTINGSHFADAFKASLLSNIQGEVGKATANWIGDQGIKFDAANSPLAEAGKIAAHGVTSGAIAEITGGKFAAGAAGGAMSEIASNWSLGAFGGNEEYQVALNKVLGGLAAAAVTGDENQFDTGADRAETVHRYNYLEHKERSERDSLLREAQKGNLTEAQQERLAALNFKDALSDETLLKACISGSASECQAARQDAITKADTYPNLGYQYPKESLAGYQQIEQLLAGTTEEAIQTQRMYDGLVASYQRMGMSAENAKTLVGYQLGAMYVFGGVAGAKSMAAVEKGIAQNKQPNVKESSGAENAATGHVTNQATSANAQAALRAKLSGLQKAQENAAITQKLPDGRVRYYTQEVPARTEGATRGASFVTEFDPKTGNTRQWMESYDHSGSVIRVHPKSINGQPVDAQHYPPTGAELKSWGQQ